MGIINKITQSPAVTHTESASAARKERTSSSVSQTGPAQPNDHADLSAEWTYTDDTKALVRQMLSSLQEKYPGISIFITGELDKDSLRNAAASLGEGSYLLLSDSFLQKIQNSQEDYEKGKSILVQLLNRLSSSEAPGRAQGFYAAEQETLYWTAEASADKPGQVQKEQNTNAFSWNGTRQDSSDISKTIYSKSGKVSLKVISHSYNNLAGARTKGQVQTVMSRARRDIANLRLAASFGDSQERMKARTAISSMQKLLQRGGRKIRRLNEAELTALRQKRAQKRQEDSRALKLKLERKKMETRRRTADACIRKEGQLEELNQSFRFRRYNRYDPDEKPENVPNIPELSLPQDIPAMQNADVPALTAADISISSVPVDF